MKTLKSISSIFFLLALLATTFVVGCQKEEMKETPAALDPNGVYYMASDGSVQQIDLDALENNPDLTFRNGNGNGNSHVNAHYSWQANSVGHGLYKSSTFQLNATENNQGVSGVGHIWRTWGAEGEFAFHTIMDAECISSNGEDAVFTGIVTQVEGDTPPLYPQVGARVWVRVKDNGQGANAPLDQYKPVIFWNPSATIPCEFFGMNGDLAFFWSWFPYENVANASDNINVN